MSYSTSRGYPLDMQEFGFLNDSSSFLDDPGQLQERLDEDGYLYLPGFFERDAVLEARRVVTDRLMREGFLDPAYPAIDGVVANVKIVNAKSAFRPPTA